MQKSTLILLNSELGKYGSKTKDYLVNTLNKINILRKINKINI